ncbi:HesA/MoeB/ThiF family protein [Cytophagaceae bacterium DM2B3-1]|uniref:HesA/MoeB/ThiF family protein n=1 Tax=Xanthocytophaga flava TaxID=3048013 RepID=A0ABT7CDW4_9BACT|nr:HesA/MoeB/ThiF family protein [Xanthocytophaga flavus]MDJ1491929.1 HesA/MoeB/ThiF family protein [Xanthocytophaga flavus]
MNMDYERYQKHLLLPEIGIEGQEKLLQARVLVVGAGGLGCPVLQYIAAAGVGTIGIIDADVVSLSNLQRQILYTTDSVGRRKVEVAKEVLLATNPTITINTYPEKFTEDNAQTLLLHYDIVVDCTDNLKARYVINDACVQANKPFVYGSIHRFEGQVAVFNYENGPTYRCLFDEGDAEPPNCADIGVLGVLPGVIGMYQALEVIKLITGIGELLSGKLLMINTLHNIHRTIKIKRRQPIISSNPQEAKTVSLKDENRMVPVFGVVKAFLQNPEVQFIDVREQALDNTVFPKEKTLHIPLSQLAGYVDELPQDKLLVVFCQSGRMSNVAVQMLTQQYGLMNVENLEGGLDRIKI